MGFILILICIYAYAYAYNMRIYFWHSFESMDEMRLRSTKLGNITGVTWIDGGGNTEHDSPPKTQGVIIIAEIGIYPRRIRVAQKQSSSQENDHTIAKVEGNLLRPNRLSLSTQSSFPRSSWQRPTRPTTTCCFRWTPGTPFEWLNLVMPWCHGWYLPTMA